MNLHNANGSLINESPAHRSESRTSERQSTMSCNANNFSGTTTLVSGPPHLIVVQPKPASSRVTPPFQQPLAEINYREEVDLDDIDLVSLGTKDLNRKLKEKGLGKTSKKFQKIKETRRTLKNRGKLSIIYP